MFTKGNFETKTQMEVWEMKVSINQTNNSIEVIINRLHHAEKIISGIEEYHVED
jgi:hypothetical protein